MEAGIADAGPFPGRSQHELPGTNRTAMTTTADALNSTEPGNARESGSRTDHLDRHQTGSPCDRLTPISNPLLHASRHTGPITDSNMSLHCTCSDRRLYP